MCIFKLEFALDICPGMGLLDHMVILFLVFLRKLHTFFHSGHTNLESFYILDIKRPLTFIFPIMCQPYAPSGLLDVVYFLVSPCYVSYKKSVVLITADWATNEQSTGGEVSFPYLSHHCLLILLILGHFDWRQFCHSRHQEIHEYVLTVGQLVHHVLQAGWQVMGVKVVIISVKTKHRYQQGPSLYNNSWSSLTENTYPFFESLNTSWMMMMTGNVTPGNVLNCLLRNSSLNPYKEPMM